MSRPHGGKNPATLTLKLTELYYQKMMKLMKELGCTTYAEVIRRALDALEGKVEHKRKPK